jgi:hypothetical protein
MINVKPGIVAVRNTTQRRNTTTTGSRYHCQAAYPDLACNSTTQKHYCAATIAIVWRALI